MNATDDSDALGETDADGLIDGDSDADGEIEADGDTEAEGDTDGLSLADGLTEAENLYEQLYGEYRLNDLIRSHSTDSALQLGEHMLQELKLWQNSPLLQQDDITWIIIDIKSSA